MQCKPLLYPAHSPNPWSLTTSPPPTSLLFKKKTTANGRFAGRCPDKPFALHVIGSLPMIQVHSPLIQHPGCYRDLGSYQSGGFLGGDVAIQWTLHKWFIALIRNMEHLKVCGASTQLGAGGVEWEITLQNLVQSHTDDHPSDLHSGISYTWLNIVQAHSEATGNVIRVGPQIKENGNQNSWPENGEETEAGHG